ncbi:beta-N-acetylhexosaminidase [Butyrivibrio sp. CB08]|uniref:glycoside hydrolase family 3 N-terminal domain-containing protein n=1 Tax=Butyrivibrio sp. CB08 TaxID=2364879 RepID=UPI000EA92DC7|nr:glycoside hydrolase family 3 N-terminal domain-containing protein [Butyrivibrio sp. CB08]RKM62269.1 beta-N-acetylhexosaminidase [Butyrivibrio sp. CB08]
MARLEEQDFDEKRLARRQRRKKSQLIAYIILASICLVVFGGCAALIIFLNGVLKGDKNVTAEAEIAQQQEEVVESAVIETPEVVTEPEEYTQEDMLGDIVNSVLEEQTLEDKVAGLFIITPEQLTGVDTAVKAGSGTQEALSNYAVGGIVYSSKNIKTTEQIKEMLDATVSMSKYPVFTFLSDQGNTSDSVKDTLALSPDIEITDGESAYQAGTQIGSQLFKYGFNCSVAPFIEMTEESMLGTDIDNARDIAAGYSKGLEESGILSCSYMFPLKGDTLSGMGTSDKSKDDLVLNEYEVFKNIIDSGFAGAIMVSNVSLPNLTQDNTPASLSDKVITEELRGTLGYEGIVITAPLSEGAITEYYTAGEAAVAAIKAGADMIYIPEDFTEAYNAVLEAASSGSISQDRIDESLRRIYAVKYADRVEQISDGN